MKSSTKIIFSCVAGILIFAVAILVGTNHPSGNTDGAIRIGVVYSLTGPAAVWSENGLDAAKLAVEEIDAAGGVNGKKIELVVQDGATDPKASVSAFERLASDQSISAVIGDMWSIVTNPLIPVADAHKILLISPTVMDVSVQGSSPYFYTVGHTVASQENAMRAFFDANPDVHTLYDVCWTDAWGVAHQQLVHKIAQEKHIDVIGESCTGDYSDDYRTEAAKVKEAHPDAVFVAATYEDTAIKALRDVGVRAKILTTTGIIEAVIARGFPIEYTHDVWFMDWQPDQEFRDAFMKRFGKYPIMEAQNSYEAVRSIVAGLKNDPSDIIAGIRSVSYASVDGSIDFTSGDHNRVNKSEAKLYQFNPDKTFREVEP